MRTSEVSAALQIFSADATMIDIRAGESYGLGE
jgi:hypothetical protein